MDNEKTQWVCSGNDIEPVSDMFKNKKKQEGVDYGYCPDLESKIKEVRDSFDVYTPEQKITNNILGLVGWCHPLKKEELLWHSYIDQKTIEKLQLNNLEPIDYLELLIYRLCKQELLIDTGSFVIPAKLDEKKDEKLYTIFEKAMRNIYPALLEYCVKNEDWISHKFLSRISLYILKSTLNHNYIKN